MLQFLAYSAYRRCKQVLSTAILVRKKLDPTPVETAAFARKIKLEFWFPNSGFLWNSKKTSIFWRWFSCIPERERFKLKASNIGNNKRRASDVHWKRFTGKLPVQRREQHPQFESKAKAGTCSYLAKSGEAFIVVTGQKQELTFWPKGQSKVRHLFRSRRNGRFREACLTHRRCSSWAPFKYWGI